MASQTKKPGVKNTKGAKGRNIRGLRGPVRKPKPWGTIAIVVALLVLAGGVFGYAFIQIESSNKFRPSDSNKDPSTQIAGVVRQDYSAGIHVKSNQRVAYDQSPPFGGPHDEAWASCEGFVYDTPVRNENMVHMLEHGAIWIAYNADKVTGGELDKLKGKVQDQGFLALSPYPGLDRPISLQSWGHQLKVDSADDERIDQFIKSLRQNKFTYPEVGANCRALGPGLFDPNSPPRFDPNPPGPDAVKMDGTGAAVRGTNGQEPPLPSANPTS